MQTGNQRILIGGTLAVLSLVALSLEIHTSVHA
jgi:hypothetical protein